MLGGSEGKFELKRTSRLLTVEEGEKQIDEEGGLVVPMLVPDIPFSEEDRRLLGLYEEAQKLLREQKAGDLHSNLEEPIVQKIENINATFGEPVAYLGKGRYADNMTKYRVNFYPGAMGKTFKKLIDKYGVTESKPKKAA